MWVRALMDRVTMADRKTICLNMIVKNEAPVIRRCLASVLPVIDRWVIVDTGSIDGTQDLIRGFFEEHGVPGELHERPWQDFAHNRSEALTLAREQADYALIIDADDALEVPPGFQMPELGADSYELDIHDGGIRYRRQQLVSNRLAWRYRGVLHEFLDCEGAAPAQHLPVVMRRNHDGARRRDPETYRKDSAVLEAALAVETDDFLKSRYTFYLAQSYRDSGEAEKALGHYLARAEMGYWQEEVFVSLLQAARIKEQLGHADDDVIAAYLRAADAQPTRVEALHGASRFCRNKGRYEEGYQIAKRGLELSLPVGALFSEPWIYDYGLRDEFTVNAYWAGHYDECLDVGLYLLGSSTLPAGDRGRISANARFAQKKLTDLRTPNAVQSRSDTSRRHPRVFLTILAKQKEPVLPFYLLCIEALDYPKDSIHLYVRTNNNTDRTADILREWINRVGNQYAHVEFDASDVTETVERFGVHEWNAIRFRVLAKLRQHSMQRTLETGCDYYFVADVDNFLKPNTLKELVAAGLPIVAPLLRHDNLQSMYSNFHEKIDASGYFLDSEEYALLLYQRVKGFCQVPVVHCTYLVRADVIPQLLYDDGSGRHEYVVFSDSARKSGVPQYLDTRDVYGYLTLDEKTDAVMELIGP